MTLIEHIYRSGCLEQSVGSEFRTETKLLELKRDRLEDQLQHSLNEQERTLFQEYEECRTELAILYGHFEFLSGFRIGGQLAIDMLHE